jgi:hypothetical protein
MSMFNTYASSFLFVIKNRKNEKKNIYYQFLQTLKSKYYNSDMGFIKRRR